MSSFLPGKAGRVSERGAWPQVVGPNFTPPPLFPGFRAREPRPLDGPDEQKIEDNQVLCYDSSPSEEDVGDQCSVTAF